MTKLSSQKVFSRFHDFVDIQGGKSSWSTLYINVAGVLGEECNFSRRFFNRATGIDKLGRIYEPAYIRCTLVISVRAGELGSHWIMNGAATNHVLFRQPKKLIAASLLKLPLRK